LTFNEKGLPTFQAFKKEYSLFQKYAIYKHGVVPQLAREHLELKEKISTILNKNLKYLKELNEKEIDPKNPLGDLRNRFLRRDSIFRESVRLYKNFGWSIQHLKMDMKSQREGFPIVLKIAFFVVAFFDFSSQDMPSRENLPEIISQMRDERTVKKVEIGKGCYAYLENVDDSYASAEDTLKLKTIYIDIKMDGADKKLAAHMHVIRGGGIRHFNEKFQLNGTSLNFKFKMALLRKSPFKCLVSR